MNSLNYRPGLLITSPSTPHTITINSSIIRNGTRETGTPSHQLRYIHDHIYAPYLSQDQSKNANGGVWPVDFTKIRMRPGGISYIYNIMTGYHYKPPYGLDVPKGKHFNPYPSFYSVTSTI